MSNPDMPVLHPEELAACELRLDGPGVWRLAAIVTLPLAIALVVEHVGVAVLCWSVLALLFGGDRGSAMDYASKCRA